MRWGGPGMSSGASQRAWQGVVWETWDGDDLLDPLFEQEVHVGVSVFEAAKAGSSRVRVDNSTAECRVQTAKVCGARLCRVQGQGRV